MTAMGYTLAAFGLILLLSRLKVPLSVAILTGAAALGVLFGLGAGQIGSAALAGATRPNSIGLAVITILLLALSQSMRAGGQLEQIVSLARAFLRRPAVAMAALPALIGLLPMPGGALFSAPMVEAAAAGGDESSGRLSAINYWYRHIWEYWWPLYPGVILAAEWTARPLEVFIAQQLPLGLFMVASGVVIFRGLQQDLRATGAPAPEDTKRRLLRSTSSIWIILIVWAVGTVVARLVFAHMGFGAEQLKARENLSALGKYGPLTVALVASLVWTARLNGIGPGGLAKIFAGRSLYDLAVLVLSVMVFGQLLEATNAGWRIGGELQALEIAPILVVGALPFIAGMVTGLAVGFVGVSFPIVLEVVRAMSGGGATSAYMVLAYACGFLGMMLSPLHLCHIVSNRYFNTTFGPVYRRIIPAVAIMFVLAVGYFELLRLLGL
ncbi:MAG: DUF401 family protein [Phycisphaerae bacterium]|jgi:hypothetical protein|nr:DUF401 family protein [Phycisphaerae bacterium]